MDIFSRMEAKDKIRLFVLAGIMLILIVGIVILVEGDRRRARAKLLEERWMQILRQMPKQEIVREEEPSEDFEDITVKGAMKDLPKTDKMDFKP